MAKDRERKEQARPPAVVQVQQTTVTAGVVEVPAERDGAKLSQLVYAKPREKLIQRIRRWISNEPCPLCAMGLGGRGKQASTQGRTRYMKCDRCGYSWKMTLPDAHACALAGDDATAIDYIVVAIYEDGAKRDEPTPPS